MKVDSQRDGGIHVALAANHRYLPGLKATLASMILSSKSPNRLRFHIFSEGLAEEDVDSLLKLSSKYGLPENNVEILRPDMTSLKSMFKPYKGSHAAFFRLYLCEFLKELDWVIYSDVDILWFRDVCDLWIEKDEKFSVMWCRDCPSIAKGVHRYSLWNPDFDESRYACSGVVLMNLKRMRETRFVLQCVDFVAKWGTPFLVDQDILNYVCRNDAKLIDQRWDCMNPDRAAPDGVVIHCNGIGARFNGPYESWLPSYNIWFEFYFKYASGTRYRTPFFKRLVFFVMSLVYPYRPLVRFFTLPFGLRWTDQLQRTLFFAWIRRRLPSLGT